MFGKDKQKTQTLFVITETNEVEIRELPTDILYAASPDTAQAWELDTNQQARGEDGSYVQVVSERSKKAIKIFPSGSLLAGRSTDAIASQKQDAELAFMNKRGQKSSMLLWLGIITAIFAVTISIVLLYSLKSSSIVALPVAVAITFPLTRGKPKKDIFNTKEDFKKLTEHKDEALKCFIFAEDNGTWSPEVLNSALIPQCATQRKYRKKPLYLLTLKTDGSLFAIEPGNTIEKDDSPQDLFLALQYEREVDETYGMDESATEKIKLTVFVVLIIIEIIVIFFTIPILVGR